MKLDAFAAKGLVRKLNVALAASAIAALLTSAPAKAAIYNFEFDQTGGGITFIGTINTKNTPDANGGYDVTSITGTVSGTSVGGTVALLGGNPGTATLSPAGQFIYDNEFYLTPPPLSNPGILFTIGGYEWNLFSTASVGPGNFSLFGTNPSSYNPTVTGDFTYTVAPVPEISTWAMMIVGFFGLGFIGYRRNLARFRIA
jgi:hypothetical protein